jgi:hypothetical protein
VLSSIHPSLQHVYPSIESLSHSSSSSSHDQPAAKALCLTLVLVCRSQAKGEHTRKLLLKEHEQTLQDRTRKGMTVRLGWWESLDIQIQTCDQSSLTGDNGVLDLCKRLRAT